MFYKQLYFQLEFRILILIKFGGTDLIHVLPMQNQYDAIIHKDEFVLGQM